MEHQRANGNDAQCDIPILCDIQSFIALVLLGDPFTDDALSPSSFKVTEPEQSTQKALLFYLNPFHLSNEIKLLLPFYIIMSHLRWEEKLHKQDPKITENPEGLRVRTIESQGPCFRERERERLSVQITLFGRFLGFINSYDFCHSS